MCKKLFEIRKEIKTLKAKLKGTENTLTCYLPYEYAQAKTRLYELHKNIGG